MHRSFTANASLAIPTSPWHLEGDALIIIGRLGRHYARSLAGSVSNLIAPRLLGSIATVSFIRYSTTPVGPYHELAVTPGVIWRGIPAAFVSHMLVDNARSQRGGRAIWGLPKEMAHFTWGPALGECAVTDAAGTALISAQSRLRRRWLGLPVPPLPFMSVRGPRRQFFTVNGSSGRLYRAHVDLSIPPASPYAPLAPLTTGPHLAFWLEGFRLRISSPYDLL